MTSRTPSDASIVPIRTQGETQTNQAQGPELFVLDSVDGISSIEELAMMLAMSEEEILQIIGRLASKNLVEWEAPQRAISEEDDEPVQTFRFVMTDDEIDAIDAIDAIPVDERAEKDTEIVDAVAASDAPKDAASPSDKSSRKSALPPRPTRRQLQPTVEHSAVDAAAMRGLSAPPPLPTESAESEAPQRRVVKTPRQHLDTSWWKSTGRTEEPDEKLTHREISNSGLRFAPPIKPSVPPPSTPADTSSSKSTAQHDVITDRVEPITATVDTSDAKEAAETSSALNEAAPKDGFIDEVAHTRGADNPLLPDIEYEEGWDPEGDVFPWADEPIADVVRSEQSVWPEDALRCVSYYLRMIEHGSYYEIFGVEQDASTDAIETAARAAQMHLQIDVLRAKASAEGQHALDRVTSGMDRAFDVLKNTASREQYDAALEALAAFKLS